MPEQDFPPERQQPLNRYIVRGAFVLDEAGTRVLYRNTLPLAHLDPNDVEGAIDA
jgi:hypothetical protein